MVIYLNNGFSQNMICEKEFFTHSKELTVKEFYKMAGNAISCISHEDLAELLGLDCNPMKIEMNGGDKMLVAQLKDRKCLMDENHQLSIDDYKFMLVSVYTDIGEMIKDVHI